MQLSHPFNPDRPTPTVLTMFVTDDFGDNFCINYAGGAYMSDRIADRRVPYAACVAAVDFAELDPDL